MVKSLRNTIKTTVSGGYKIEEDDENGNLKALKLYDDNNNLIAYVLNTEEKILSE